MNPIRRRSTRASRAYRPPGALLPFSSPSAIFLPSDSDTDDSALASLASLSTSSTESARDLHMDISKVLKKQQPKFQARFQAWTEASHNSPENLNPDIILTQRLCVFYNVELTAFLSNQEYRLHSYRSQNKDISYQLTRLELTRLCQHDQKLDTQYPAHLGDVQSLRLAIEKSLFNKDPRSKWIPIPWEGVHKT